MAIIRAKKDNNFTVIDNAVFQRHQLSFQAMGLLGYVLSKPDNWTVHVNELVDATKNTSKEVGEKVVYAIINELIAKGFVSRKKHQNGKVDYTFYDKPEFANIPNGKQQNPQTAISADSRKPNLPNGDALVNTDYLIRTEEKKVSTEINASADASVSAPVKAKRQNRKADAIALLVANGVSEQIANDFMAVRTGKRAGTLTETAMNGIAIQAAKAGLTVEQAVTICIDRNWVGFNADWIKPTNTRVNKTDSSWLLLKSRKEAVVAWDEAKREALVTRRNHESADWKEPQWMPVPDVNLLNQIRQHFVEAA